MNATGHRDEHAAGETEYAAAADESMPAPGAGEDHNEDPGQFGAFGDDPEAEIESAGLVEADLLTALMWAPREVAANVVRILLHTDVDEADRRPVRLVSPMHELVLSAIATVLATGAPAQPSLVLETLRGAGEYRRVVEHASWLSLVSPTGRPAPSVEVLPHLAAQVCDGHYRRGFRALTDRMAQVQQELPIEDLKGKWDQLSWYAERAEADWLDRRDELARMTSL